MAPPPVRSPQRALLGSLVLLTLATFSPALGNGFVAFDDWSYVVGNPVVGRGLTLDGVRWAFTATHAANWHPLTWLSHMADVELFGLDPAGHHLTSIVLHAAGALLLGWGLSDLTGRRGRGWVVAALFAIHPTRIESVAWIAERKDVLCGVFWIAATWSYARAARSAGPARFAPALLLFTLGLLCKPMIVTLPVLLLVLDATVLGRVRDWRTDAPGLLREKIPFFALAAAACVATYAAQSAGGAVQSAAEFPWTARVANVPIAYAGYLKALFWPFGLSVFYAHPQLSAAASETPPWLESSLVALALGLLTLAVLRSGRPWLQAGWLWFAIALLPVIGLVQVGEQSRADRYSYVPYIGLFAALAWGAGGIFGTLARRARAPRLATWAPVPVATLAVAGCAFGTVSQLGYWHDSIALFTRALQLDPGNVVARQNLAGSLVLQNRLDEARPLVDEVLRRRPDHHVGLRTRAEIALRRGDLDAAARDLERLVVVMPEDLLSVANLAAVSTRRGELEPALRLFGRLRRRAPDFRDVAYPYAIALLASGDLASGAAQLEAAVAEHPERADWRAQREEARRLLDGGGAVAVPDGPLAQTLRQYHLDLAAALQRRGRKEEARHHEQEAARWAPFSR